MSALAPYRGFSPEIQVLEHTRIIVSQKSNFYYSENGRGQQIHVLSPLKCLYLSLHYMVSLVLELTHKIVIHCSFVLWCWLFVSLGHVLSSK